MVSLRSKAKDQQISRIAASKAASKISARALFPTIHFKIHQM